MKKINPYSLLFVFYILLIIIGIRGDYSAKLKEKTIGFAAKVRQGKVGYFYGYRNYIDRELMKELIYHDRMMDASSIKENVLGTRVIIKNNNTIVKAASGSLIEPVEKIDESEIKKIVAAISELQAVSEKNGACFLYCAAPRKEYFEEAPANIDNCFKENYSLFLSELERANVPAIDFTETLIENAAAFNTYYDTDHHWTARAGFAANNALVEALNARYGFQYHKQFTDIRNYDIVTYSDWFLGSKGKKNGRFFTSAGADDFELIIPKFQTDMTEEQPIKNSRRDGAFQDTVLYLENLKKDYYNINTYATYSGGDFRLQIMRNNLNPQGKKILIIRDSFACVVAPFLSLHTSELHICDMRNYKHFVGDKINVEEYIERIKPDYVLVLYGGVFDIKNADEKYDFFTHHHP